MTKKTFKQFVKEALQYPKDPQKDRHIAQAMDTVNEKREGEPIPLKKSVKYMTGGYGNVQGKKVLPMRSPSSAADEE